MTKATSTDMRELRPLGELGLSPSQRFLIKPRGRGKNMKETIIGDALTFEEHPEYKGEYIAKWRGYTVAVAAVQDNGRVNITEYHPDQESTRSCSVGDLNKAWREIKNYTLTAFDD